MLKAVKGVILLLLLSLQWQSAISQTYFEGLYGDDISAGGMGSGGMNHFGSGYFVWSSNFEPFKFSLWSFTVDTEGGLINEVSHNIPDTISEQAGNILVLDDTMLVGLSYQMVLTDPSVTQGDVVLTCISPGGGIYWRQVYGMSNRREIPQRVIRCTDGGYAIVGQVIITPDVNAMVYLVRTDSLGNQLWEQMYGGSQYDSGGDLVQTPDGGFLLLGWTYSYGAGQRDFYLVKTNNLGDFQWQMTFGTSDLETGTGIIELSDGNYLLAGQQIVGGLDKGKLIKIQPDGEVIWQNEYLYPGCTASEVNMVTELHDGSIIGAGVSDRSEEGNSGWLLKTDSEGTKIWQRKFNKNEYTDLFYTMLATDDGGFLLGGQAVNEETMSQDAWLLKVDSVGCAYPNCITGIAEQEHTVLIDAWPNPCNDVLNIELPSDIGTMELWATDMAGKEMLRHTQHETRGTIDVGHWPQGAYVLRGMDGKGRTFSMKIMK